MKRTSLAPTLIFVLLFSVVAGKWFVNMGKANPAPPIETSFGSLNIEILSPKNQTYLTNPVDLTVRASVHWVIYNIQYSVDGGPWMYLYHVGGGYEYTVTKNISLTLSSGFHTITAKTVHFGTTVCANVTFAVDMASPYLTVLLPENKNYSTAEIPLNFETQGLSVIRYSLDGKQPVSVAGNTSLKAVPDGFHSLVLYGTSALGTTLSSGIVYFQVDTLPPEITISSLDNKTYYGPDLPLNFTVNESVSQIAYSLDGQGNVTIVGNTTLTGLGSGDHNVKLYVTDKAGNIGTSETIYFTIVEPFPTTLVIASIVVVTVTGIYLLFYFKKRSNARINKHSEIE